MDQPDEEKKVRTNVSLDPSVHRRLTAVSKTLKKPVGQIIDDLVFIHLVSYFEAEKKKRI